MEVVTGALSSLLPKLADLLVGEYNLHKGVKGEIMFLQAELESMKVALEELSDAPVNRIDKLDKIWARDVRELSYDIEDSIDTFTVRGSSSGEPLQPHGFNKFIDRSLGLLTRARIHHKVATDLRDIRSRVMEVSERRQRYKVHSLAGQPVQKTSDDPRLFAHYTKSTELVGVDEARDEVTKILMGGDGEMSKQQQQQDKIVSIVGFGGLGKTALAKAVYEKLRAQFDCSAFVSVSQSPDKEKLFQDMFYQFAKRNSARINVRDEILEILQSKRYSVHTYYIYTY
jgi:adenylate kinase